MKPCYGCKTSANACAGSCERYHAWMSGLKADPDALRRQQAVDGYVLRRELWRQNL